uniref:phenylalanine--tRNA ligase n=1 Tax=Spyridia filamentosa TaxID=196632 RepID=A0A1Z1MJT2_SPYFI|nr:Phenylalanine-tRNA ligase beta subunit [Spyridia filamentosa]ARW66303.1 Phenylalanine-tRNA ligase beta subunit [Spyridia filamentosa]
MKVSWKCINKLINLRYITLSQFTQKITEAGFEIEKISNIYSINDLIIELNITSNRLDICNFKGLAKEIRAIFNLKFSDFTIINKSQKIQLNNYALSNNHMLLNQIIGINIITNLQLKSSPIWLIDYLKTYNIKSGHILDDICNYIKIKWNQDIYIFNISKIKHNTIRQILLNLQKNNNLRTNLTIQENNEFADILNYLSKNNQKKKINNCIYHFKKSDWNITKIILININNHHHNCQNYFIDAEQEALVMISTLCKGITGKSYNNYSYSQTQESIISIKKQEINRILGPTKQNNYKFLSTKNIIEILKQANLYILYKNKQFFVKVPKERSQDLKRKIDIIEEISRIHGFKNFIDSMPQKKKRNEGQYKKTVILKKIRQILYNYGLHEAINSSLIQLIDRQKNIKIHNSLSADQSHLRSNLIRGLINNYLYNINQQNDCVELFEIGEVFELKESQAINSRQITHLACILKNNIFTRKYWSEKPYSIDWFHAKGIFEELFEKIEAGIDWIDESMHENQVINETIQDLINFCKPNRRSLLISNETNNIIGMFGELNSKYQQDIKGKDSVYVFEINVNKLIETIQSKKHLEHRMTPYSLYPYVIRDICITLEEKKNIKSIKEIIYKTNSKSIESVKIFNEYFNKSKALRSVGLRIQYREFNKTLNQFDLDEIDKNIQLLLNQL